jgi:hypothetical protein
MSVVNIMSTNSSKSSRIVLAMIDSTSTIWLVYGPLKITWLRRPRCSEVELAEPGAPTIQVHVRLVAQHSHSFDAQVQVLHAVCYTPRCRSPGH